MWVSEVEDDEKLAVYIPFDKFNELLTSSCSDATDAVGVGLTGKVMSLPTTNSDCGEFNIYAAKADNDNISGVEETEEDAGILGLVDEDLYLDELNEELEALIESGENTVWGKKYTPETETKILALKNAVM